MYDKGFIVATDGNISARYGNDEIIITPSGLCKGDMEEDELIITDMTGNTTHPHFKPSSEIFMHLAVYRQRTDVQAIVHAHPPLATAFSLVNMSFEDFILPELVMTLGMVPMAKYATPGTEEGAMAIEDLIKDNDGLLLPRHGTITVGKDLFDAYYKLERLEHAARTIFTAKLLGSLNPLSSNQVSKLLEIKEKSRPSTDLTSKENLDKFVSVISQEIIRAIS